MPEEQGDPTATVIVDYQGRPVRLTEERRAHILEHPEMVGQLARLVDVLTKPELVVATLADESVHVYQCFYKTR